MSESKNVANLKYKGFYVPKEDIKTLDVWRYPILAESKMVFTQIARGSLLASVGVS